MRANMSQRDERIDLRVSGDLKTLLSRAAAYSGMSLSSFLISALNHAYLVDATPATLALRAKRISCDLRNKLCQ